MKSCIAQEDAEGHQIDQRVKLGRCNSYGQCFDAHKKPAIHQPKLKTVNFAHDRIHSNTNLLN
jgi:hypothetical protein